MSSSLLHYVVVSDHSLTWCHLSWLLVFEHLKLAYLSMFSFSSCLSALNSSLALFQLYSLSKEAKASQHGPKHLLQSLIDVWVHGCWLHYFTLIWQMLLSVHIYSVEEFQSGRCVFGVSRGLEEKAVCLRIQFQVTGTSQKLSCFKTSVTKMSVRKCKSLVARMVRF